MLKLINNYLDRTTMYRLLVHVLVFWLVIAGLFSLLGLFAFNVFSLFASAIIITLVCWLTNVIFAKTFKAPVNKESYLITALILILIITPPKAGAWLPFLSLAGWAAAWAMASKYIFAIGKKHIFNPAAFGIVITALFLHQSAVWWIGSTAMMPFVVAGGLLIIKKIRQWDLIGSFFVISIMLAIGHSLLKGGDIFLTFRHLLFNSPIFFLAFVMLTEPLTTPPDKIRRIIYGGLVGLFFLPFIHIGSFYFTPELALLTGNVFSYLASPKRKLILTFLRKEKIADHIYNFSFKKKHEFHFKPGQYMEWTLPHHHPDNRGNRRYLTLASSPTEDEICIGVKFYPESSSFKNKLKMIRPGSVIVASQLAGDFVLPLFNNQKMVFIAGGIGITPFRSMIKYLIDTDQSASIILFYANSALNEIAYKTLFNRAQNKIGLKTVYTLTNPQNISSDWQGYVGYINSEMIKKEVPDYNERIFYLSGPRSMVMAYKKLLKKIGLKRNQIKIDFFPGFC